MAKHTKVRAFDVVCKCCGVTFTTGSGIKLYCSPECRVRSAAAAFSGLDSCWEWDGSRNPQTGYGQLSAWEDGKRKLYTAHRVSFRAFNGEIPEGQLVLHRCDNRPCFNPAHLFTGSQKANMEDMAMKGRGTQTGMCGSAHHSAKLSDADVLQIRASTEKLAVLVARFGVSQSVVSSVRNRKTWRHI